MARTETADPTPDVAPRSDDKPAKNATTVAISSPYWIDEFHPNVDGAPDVITASPVEINPQRVDAVRDAAKVQNIQLTVKGA